MRHLYACPVRWGDLDLLGHVNNVVYVDYLQEARVDMMRTHTRADDTGALAEGVVVVRHEVEYVAPLGIGFEPVLIESWVSQIRAASFTLDYEVFHERPEAPGGRVVYLRARSLLAPYVFATERPRRLTAEERTGLEVYLETDEAQPTMRPRSFSVPRDERWRYPVQVRFSDIDVYRHVNNVEYLDYYQEARIRMMRGLLAQLDAPGYASVIARTEVDYLAPILLRATPYDCWSGISRFGNRSMTVDSEITDGDTVLSRARVVLVAFDLETGRSTEPPAAAREALSAALFTPS